MSETKIQFTSLLQKSFYFSEGSHCSQELGYLIDCLVIFSISGVIRCVFQLLKYLIINPFYSITEFLEHCKNYMT